ncbi:MAG: hypothetical protein CMJ83_01405 [Planctomycetes bacterium]|nr:hypothetical protein [Planctomycetota bacterium]
MTEARPADVAPDVVEAPPPTPPPAPAVPDGMVLVSDEWVAAFRAWTRRFESFAGHYDARERARTEWMGDFNVWLDRWNTWADAWERQAGRQLKDRQAVAALRREWRERMAGLKRLEDENAALKRELEAWRRLGRRQQ